MDERDSWTEVLARLRPLLETIFAAYGTSLRQAQEIVEEACLELISKRPRRQDPDGWLLRRVIERCQTLAEEEEREDGEDA